MAWENQLYFGDNLNVLREHVPDECVDLVYLDPPFNSNATYNVLFKEKTGSESAAQIQAFDDTWQWNIESEKIYNELATGSHEKLADLIVALRSFLGTNDMMAYLVMMAARLLELHRVLKPTGSLYLHCDPTASHYLKLLLDAILGPTNFINEIIWRRSHPKGLTKNRFANNHDVILSFAKDISKLRWNVQYIPHELEKAKKQYSFVDEDGRRYQLTSLLNPNPNRPNLTYDFCGVTKVWRWTKQRMLSEQSKGRIVVPRGGKGIPRYKRYLDEQQGIPISDFWDDISFASGAERLGYPTQKPEALLERIIKASSNEGDLVLDPFCGCGTTITVAERLNRRWIGIDITHLAITLMKARLEDSFGSACSPYIVRGEPTDLEGARALKEQDPYQFQFWALGLVKAHPLEGKKKGSDRGIDGVLGFIDDDSNQPKRILLQIKGGHVNASHIRDLRGTIEREGAAIGAFITLEPPSGPMKLEAAEAGLYIPEYFPDLQYPKIQILTIEGLLKGTERLEYPRVAPEVTFKRAEKKEKKLKSKQQSMFN